MNVIHVTLQIATPKIKSTYIYIQVPDILLSNISISCFESGLWPFFNVNIFLVSGMYHHNSRGQYIVRPLFGYNTATVFKVFGINFELLRT